MGVSFNELYVIYTFLVYVLYFTIKCYRRQFEVSWKDDEGGQSGDRKRN